ncbi:hypothetical protein ACHAWF_008825 [Thalassiosira exigua]
MKMKAPSEALTMIGAAVSKVATNDDQISASVVAPHLPPWLQERIAAHDAEHDDDHVVPARHLTRHRHRHRPLHSPSALETSHSCDASFFKCMLSAKCHSCFKTIQEEKIDWTNIVPETPCQEVLGLLVSGGHCTDIRWAGHKAHNLFCATFDSCMVWDESEGDGETNRGPAKTHSEAAPNDVIDCTSLKECNWPGMHEHFLGDGVCHDALPGCYNSKVCNFDGGDCCEDTCHYPLGASKRGGGEDYYGECGLEGYACRDPSSTKCESTLVQATEGTCDIQNDQDAFDENEELPSCSSNHALYRLVQYDSWGDGWDQTVMTIREADQADTFVYRGGLDFGYEGTKYLCLSKKEPKCYHVTVENGIWANEISWELRPLAGGAPALATGGSPADCTVPIAGGSELCPNTCVKAETMTKRLIDDPNIHSFSDMKSCIEEKCLIQTGQCSGDPGCSECMVDNTPDYCYANDNFNVLTDCSICACSEKKPDYCAVKQSGAAMSGSTAATHRGKSGEIPLPMIPGPEMCTPEQALRGADSVVNWSECTDISELVAMLTFFDNDNFGALDQFESCAQTYANEPLHGGKKALDCMNILFGLTLHKRQPIANAKGELLEKNVVKSIHVLARRLYRDAEGFCECTADINRETPMCNHFVNFKTLLYEAVDACRSLDAIDCAAWEEFQPNCERNLLREFGSIDFNHPSQCSYVKHLCGGAGPFPAFRRLDCGKEVAKSVWDFHTLYQRGCLKKKTSHTHTHQPNSANGSRLENESNANARLTKTHHFVRNFFFALLAIPVVYLVQKRRQENFKYMKFIQMREARINFVGNQPYSGGGCREYGNISMTDSCSFEPPLLPPTPSSNVTCTVK